VSDFRDLAQQALIASLREDGDAVDVLLGQMTSEQLLKLSGAAGDISKRASRLAPRQAARETREAAARNVRKDA
jgi:hypothetical protein